MANNKKKLGEILVEWGILNPKEQQRLADHVTSAATQHPRHRSRESDVQRLSRPTADFAWWVPLIRFLGHTAAASAIFVLIASVAVLLNLYVHQLARLRVSSPLIVILEIAEYALAVADAILYLVFLTKTGWRTAREI